MQSCCHSALQSLLQAMAIRANKSRSVFLELNEAQDCTNTFQNLHNRTNLSTCELRDFISSSRATILSPSRFDSSLCSLALRRDSMTLLRRSCSRSSFLAASRPPRRPPPCRPDIFEGLKDASFDAQALLWSSVHLQCICA